MAAAWQAWPATRQAAGFFVFLALIAIPLGTGEALGSAALAEPRTATGTVLRVNDGGGPFTRNSTFLEVQAAIDGRVRDVRVDRLARPLPARGDRYAIEYGSAPIVGLVAQQAGYRAGFPRTWGMLLVGTGFAVAGASLAIWSVVRPGPPANAPRPPPGPSLAERPDWSHRLRRPDADRERPEREPRP
ncbi:MAG: hypothetical protein ACT4QF_19410 [Sporichthyaceae bacterium]